MAQALAVNETTEQAAFEKTVYIGTIEIGRIEAKVFVHIKFDGRLSITGVEGPRRDGNALGSSGQIIMSYREYDRRGHMTLDDIAPAPGWDHAKIRQLFNAWDAWHLNDMRAGCVHQRVAWDTEEQLEVIKYKLTTEAIRMRTDAVSRAAQCAAKEERADLSETERALVLLADWYADKPAPPDADNPLSGCYEVASREIKAAGGVYPSEHPRGLLTKPCEACGYKYGSAWLTEEVPVGVLNMLRELPDTDVTPAWV